MCAWRMTSKNLIGAIGIGGVVVGCTGILLHKRMQTNFKESPQIRESLNNLRRHPGAEYLLGKPIKEFMVNLTDKNSVKRQKELNQVIYKLPVKGPKGEGFFYIYLAHLPSSEERPEDGGNGWGGSISPDWSAIKGELEILNTSELEADRYEGRRMMIFNESRPEEKSPPSSSAAD